MGTVNIDYKSDRATPAGIVKGMRTQYRTLQIRRKIILDRMKRDTERVNDIDCQLRALERNLELVPNLYDDGSCCPRRAAGAQEHSLHCTNRGA